MYFLLVNQRFVLLKRVWYLLFSMIAVICAIGNVLPLTAKEAWIVLMRFLFLSSGDCFVRNEAFTSPIPRETSLASLRISVVNRKAASFDRCDSVAQLLKNRCYRLCELFTKLK